MTATEYLGLCVGLMCLMIHKVLLVLPYIRFENHKSVMGVSTRSHSVEADRFIQIHAFVM